MTFLLPLALFSLVAFVRVLVGFQPHSGQNNYHGSQVAWGGDYEAQRHWMEVTLHLPIGRWYHYDLEYWGLDYPPLTAYQSYLCGFLSDWIVGPESVALDLSRGYEDETHKAFMRATVLVLDLLVYGTAVWRISREVSKRWFFFLFAMLQPAILLIDHGHFQYNTTALGLALWAFHFMSQESMISCVVGSIFFCCALSFKQMTLYYAPAVFCYLLGRCFADRQRWFGRFLALGVTVIVTFALLWWPFVVYGPNDDEYAPTTYLENLRHVLHRVLPFQRGLFEGKVSNLWCVLSLSPFRIRRRIPQHLQPLAALALTAVLIAPSCYKLFQTGLKSFSRRQHLSLLLWGTTSCALSFFLASFQVHEKSLLIALAPATLLAAEESSFVEWFSLATAWTLWPLLVIDRLQTAYFCLMASFVAFLQISRLTKAGYHTKAVTWVEEDAAVQFVLSLLYPLSYVAMVLLHLIEAFVEVPPHLNMPDLYPVLFSILGCGCCCLAWLITVYKLFRASPKEKAA